jgi:hypothetical protein
MKPGQVGGRITIGSTSTAIGYWCSTLKARDVLSYSTSGSRIVLTDHHEMGTNNTFFFMPGIPQRTNPITPPKKSGIDRQNRRVSR